MKATFQVTNLASSLESIAQSFQEDAKQLTDFADQLRAAPDTDYTDSALHSNIVFLLGRAMNNSSWVSSMESALHSASELARHE